MKKILVSALVSLPLAVLAQKPFTIAGDIKGLKAGDKIYLTYKTENGLITDSSTVAKGKFQFKGTLTSPVQGNLYLNKNLSAVRQGRGEIIDKLAFYVEPANIKLTAADSLSKVNISGSVVNDDDKKLSALTKPLSAQMTSIDTEFIELPVEERKARQPEFASKYYALLNQKKLIQMRYVKANIKSFVSLITLSQLMTDAVLFADVEKTYESMGPELKSTKAGKDLAAAIVVAKKTAVGAMAMDFTQNDVNDKPVKLSDFKGKYVLLDFWASWCGPCRAENPNVVKAFNAYKDKNFTVLGVSLDQPGKKDAWLAAIERDGLTWTHVSDLKFWGNEAAKLYNIRSIPANLLIDPTGKIIAKDIRGEELLNKLASLFGVKSE